MGEKRGKEEEGFWQDERGKGQKGSMGVSLDSQNNPEPSVLGQESH